MLGNLAKSVFGSSNDRYVKSLDKLVQQVAAFEPALQAAFIRKHRDLLT